MGYGADYDNLDQLIALVFSECLKDELEVIRRNKEFVSNELTFTNQLPSLNHKSKQVLLLNDPEQITFKCKSLRVSPYIQDLRNVCRPNGEFSEQDELDRNQMDRFVSAFGLIYSLHKEQPEPSKNTILDFFKRLLRL